MYPYLEMYVIVTQKASKFSFFKDFPWLKKYVPVFIYYLLFKALTASYFSEVA